MGFPERYIAYWYRFSGIEVRVLSLDIPRLKSISYSALPGVLEIWKIGVKVTEIGNRREW